MAYEARDRLRAARPRRSIARDPRVLRIILSAGGPRSSFRVLRIFDGDGPVQRAHLVAASVVLELFLIFGSAALQRIEALGWGPPMGRGGRPARPLLLLPGGRQPGVARRRAEGVAAERSKPASMARIEVSRTLVKSPPEPRSELKGDRLAEAVGEVTVRPTEHGARARVGRPPARAAPPSSSPPAGARRDATAEARRRGELGVSAAARRPPRRPDGADRSGAAARGPPGEPRAAHRQPFSREKAPFGRARRN